MIYCTLENDRISGIFAADTVPEGAQALPANFAGIVGQHRDEFDEEWNLFPLSERVASGHVEIDPHYKLDGGDIVPKNFGELVDAGLVEVDERHVLVGAGKNAYIRDKHPLELMRDGLESVPKGFKLEPDDSVPVIGLALIPKTLTEQVSSGEITEQTAEIVQTVNMRVERDAMLAGCDWTMVEDVPLSANEKAAWTAYRQALRDVPEQGGFPWVIEWPVRPDGAQA